MLHEAALPFFFFFIVCVLSCSATTVAFREVYEKRYCCNLYDHFPILTVK